MATTRYGRYEVRRELGRGGTAVVYLAYDPAVGRDVALKVLPSALPDDDQYRARLRLEAKLVAALDHPHIVPIFDFGEEGDRPYLVMRYLAGGTLAQRIGGRPMPLREFAPIALRLAEALTAAHAQGIIHRDLKPSNVLFDQRGEPYLTDFGIAKIVQGALQHSLTGTAIVGTPAYMSPEQAMGERTIDQRSDIYGLGVMTFEALTGTQPFQADTPMRVVLKHLQDPPPHLSPDQLDQLDLPPELDGLLQQALAKAPGERFSTALEFALPLMQLAGLPDPDKTTVKAPAVRLAGAAAPVTPVVDALAPTLTTPAPVHGQPARRPRPWRALGLAGAASLVIGLAAWGGSALPTGEGPTPSPSPTASVTSLSAQALTATAEVIRAAQASVTAIPTVLGPATRTVRVPTRTARATQTATAEPTATATATAVRPTRAPATLTPPRPEPTAPPPEPTAPPPQPTSPPPQPTSPPPTSPPEPTSTAAPPDEGATPTPAPP